MREILFRGKTNKLDWVYGDLIQLNDGRKFIVNNKFGACIDDKGNFINTEAPFVCNVFPESVSEFTGLTDKNGTKIFEGDIIRYADIHEYRMYLESLECPEDYEENAFNDMWTIDEVVYGINIGYPAFDLNNHDWEVNGLSNLNESGQFYFEVIGNIHDNPELLGGGEE